MFEAAGVSLYPAGLRAPAWVAYTTCAAFVLGGFGCLARAYGRPRAATVSVLFIMSAMLVVELWIAFGAGERQCSTAIAGIPALASGGSCRMAFGIAAAVLAGMLLVVLRSLLRPKSEG